MPARTLKSGAMSSAVLKRCSTYAARREGPRAAMLRDPTGLTRTQTHHGRGPIAITTLNAATPLRMRNASPMANTHALAPRRDTHVPHSRTHVERGGKMVPFAGYELRSSTRAPA